MDSGGGLTTERSVSLELDVSGRDGTYRVEARSAVGGECFGEVVFEREDHLIEQSLQRLRLALLSSAASTRRLPSRDEKAVQLIGGLLFNRLFTGDIRMLLDTTRQVAAQQSRPVRLVLRIRPPELASMPWEFLYDARRDDYLSLSMPLVRYTEVLEPVRPLMVTSPLRILGMSSRPGSLDQLDVAAERAHLQHALSDLGRTRRVELTWTVGETWRDLVRALNQDEWHILHLVGHGGYDEAAGEGVFYLAGEDGGSYPLRASRLAQVLNLHPSLRLVLLNSCESAVGNSSDIFSSAAATLIRRGVPAVLAMQYEISDRAAVEFTRSFYEAVAAGLPIDAAVRDARLAVSLARPDSLEWGTPVLFLRQSDGRIFDVTSSVPAADAAPGVEPAAAPAAPAQQRRRLTEPMPAPSNGTAPGRPTTPQYPGGPDRHAAPPRHAARLVGSASVPRPPQQRPTPRRSRRTAATAAAAAGLCLLAASVVVALRAAGGDAATVAVTVPGEAAWTPTHVTLAAGQHFKIEATGVVHPRSGTSNGPDGVPGAGDNSRVVGARYGALIGRIGSGAPFAVGSELSATSDTAGELALGVNDLQSDDNTGSFSARIAY
ncbi:MAG TPA: CHAT domain-containing protein [Micromonosporaceae bacterium]